MANTKSTREIRKYWYNKLPFPPEFEADVQNARGEIEIMPQSSINTYDIKTKDGRKNLLSYLYFCENLKNEYEKRGIGEDILLDTLYDIVIWLTKWSDLEGGLYLGETDWIKRHLEMKLFRLGRLQFCMAGAECDIPEKNIKKGDNILEIHIPSMGPLNNEKCRESIKMAKEFFKKYYPEYEYKAFTCHSWLLDRNLKKYLDENTNIIKFQNMFNVIEDEESDAILKFVFKWNAKRENINEYDCRTQFMEKIKESALNGEIFYQSYGILIED